MTAIGGAAQAGGGGGSGRNREPQKDPNSRTRVASWRVNAARRKVSSPSEGKDPGCDGILLLDDSVGNDFELVARSSCIAISGASSSSTRSCIRGGRVLEDEDDDQSQEATA